MRRACAWKKESGLVRGETFDDNVLHMVLCLTSKFSMFLVESKYRTHEINDLDEAVSHV
jgi:hypothetical protein